MCGIAGWIDYYQDLSQKDATLKDMSITLERRGPDAGGIYKSENCCIIHRRLSVVDFENGKQPMHRHANNSEYILTYNGELYNTEELRQELVSLGYSFEGHSDTEVLLAAYCEWDVDCLSKFNGIFAFGVWDTLRQQLFLARDRLGVKPLFFYEYQGGLIFGSEIKTLLANPIVQPIVTREGLAEIFFLGPGRTSGNGIFKGVKELCPGEYAYYNREGLYIKSYWSLKAAEHTENYQQTIEKTGWLIGDSITRQLVSDVPLCCFLSGGLDSSIITYYAAEDYKKSNRQLTTYSVDYADNLAYFKKSLYQPDADNIYIELMGKVTGANLRYTVLDNADLASALGEATIARDLPGMVDIDSSLLLFCREIKKDFTVALSGECADEIFGGYPWYHNADLLAGDSFPWSHSLSLRKSILLDQTLAKMGEDYTQSAYLNTLAHTDKLDTDTPHTTRMREMFMLNVNWFMETLLDRKDRMSMYSGLEVRVPFCDHRLVEYAFNMPWEMKSANGREKGIMREAMNGILPDEIVWRKKAPYPKTHHPIYFEIVKTAVMKLFEDKESIISQLIDRKQIEELAAHPDKLAHPWYGQLMGVPQILAYIIQIDQWFKKNKVRIE